jgi:3',5'-cyclic-AMP phosphodiesterase
LADLSFLHHRPLDIGLPSMDGIKLIEPERGWKVFQHMPRPDVMLLGYVHGPVTGLGLGIPSHIQRAICHQAGFDIATAGDISEAHAPPGYSPVSVTQRNIVILERPFLHVGPGFSLNHQAARDETTPEGLAG